MEKKINKVSLGDRDDYVEFDDKIEVGFLWKVLCCFCLLFEPKSHVIRLRKKIVTFDESVEPTALLETVETAISVSDQGNRAKASLKIQALVRGRQGRKLAKRRLQEAIRAVDSHWNGILQKRLDDRERERRLKEARRLFSERYVRDVLHTAVSFLVQSNASVVIQRTWRGYWSRKTNRPRRRIPPPRKRQVARRHGMDSYRRVWARSRYEPSGGWPGKFDYLHYDMWDHAQHPPVGREYGLKTYKVIAVPRSDRERNLLLEDKNAWVGLPYAFCPFRVHQEEQIQKTKSSMGLLSFSLQNSSPYNVPVVNLQPLVSKAPLELRKQMVDQSLAASLAAAQEMAAAETALGETETEEEARKRAKSKFFGVDNGPAAMRSRHLRTLADQYFSGLAETSDLPSELKAKLVTGVAHTQSVDTDIAGVYVPSKGNARRGARKPLTKSQQNALRHPIEGIDSQTNAVHVSTKYASCKESLSLEEPRLQRLQQLAKKNNYSAPRKLYSKIRDQFIHNYQSPLREVGIVKGSNRDSNGLVNESAWKSSAWSKVKRGVEKIRDRTVTARVAADHADDLDPSDFIHSMVGTGVVDQGAVDSYISVWGRSVFRPKRKVEGRARVWAVKPKRHYKLRYSWLPQPMVNEAANIIYGDRDDANTRVSSIDSTSEVKADVARSRWQNITAMSADADWSDSNSDDASHLRHRSKISGLTDESFVIDGGDEESDIVGRRRFGRSNSVLSEVETLSLARSLSLMHAHRSTTSDEQCLDFEYNSTSGHASPWGPHGEAPGGIAYAKSDHVSGKPVLLIGNHIPEMQSLTESHPAAVSSRMSHRSPSSKSVSSEPFPAKSIKTVKTPSFDKFIKTTKFRPYHRINRTEGQAEQPYPWL